MMGAAALLRLLFAASLVQAPAALQPDENEAAIRAAVQQYYEAQSGKDVDKALAFWSTGANPRMSREAFVALFAAGDAQYTPEIQAVAIKGNEARVRIGLTIARTIVRNDVPSVVRQTQLNAELWKREGAVWKLYRDGPAAEDFADELLAADAAGRARLMAENPAELTSGLRYVLSQRASLMIPGRQYAKAREIFELALAVARATNDRRSESETLQNIANAYYFLQEFEPAIDYYQQRLALARTMQDEDATAASITGLATVAYSRGEYTAALASYREALAIYEKRDDGASIGRALISVGNVQFLQADYDAATASYRRALDLLVAGFDRPGASFARSGLGRVFAAQGDLAAALTMYGQVLADARAMLVYDPRSRGNVVAPLASIGEIYYRLGNTDQARASFVEARTLSEGDPSGIANLSASLGLTELVAGRFDAALAAYTESRTRFEQAKDPEGVGRAWVGIGFSQTSREKYADAIAAYRSAIQIFDGRKDVENTGRAWLGLSLAQSASGDYAEALNSARRVRATAEAIKSEDLAWRAAVSAGEALRRLKRLDEARDEYQRGIVAIDRLAADAPVNPEARGQLDDSGSAWTGLALTLAAGGDARGALDAVEARRAHARRVQLAPFQRDVTRGMTADEQAEEQSIVRELISTRAQLGAERGAPHPDAARIDRLQQQFTALSARRGEQQAKLYARLPELQQWRALQPPALDLAALTRGVDGLVVEYLVGEDQLLVVTVASGDSGPEVAAAIVPFKRHDTAEQIAQAMQPAVLADASAWRTQSAAIAAAVLAPIESRLVGRARCVIVPDDLLWKIPFEALPSGEKVLGARLAVSYATSLATLGLQQRLAATRKASDRPAAAMFAAPAIPDAVRAQLSLAQTGWKEPDETAAVRIAADAAHAYGDSGTVRSKEEASESAARAAADAADVVHIAGPLQVSGATPLFSMVVLGSDTVNDGRWEVREWFGSTARARVLVFTDGTSFGSLGVGGAMDSLAWAAAALGVPALVVGRWPADAFTSDAVLGEFHASLAKGLTPAAAWNRAVSSVRARSAAPSSWAGLRLIGAGR